MNKLILVVGLFAASVALPVFAGTPCEEVKAQIAKKLDDMGIKAYTLDAVAVADVKDQKVIGNCDGGKQKIVYTRGAAKAAKAEAKTAEPAAPAAAEPAPAMMMKAAPKK
jgi:hypothetical protein